MGDDYVSTPLYNCIRRLKEDIEMVDKTMSDSGVWSHHRQAWYRIKAFVKAQIEKEIENETK
jgi:hypothetical protein